MLSAEEQRVGHQMRPVGTEGDGLDSLGRGGLGVQGANRLGGLGVERRCRTAIRTGEITGDRRVASRDGQGGVRTARATGDHRDRDGAHLGGQLHVAGPLDVDLAGDGCRAEQGDGVVRGRMQNAGTLATADGHARRIGRATAEGQLGVGVLGWYPTEDERGGGFGTPVTVLQVTVAWVTSTLGPPALATPAVEAIRPTGMATAAAARRSFFMSDSISLVEL